MNILIRVDSSPKIGVGHYMRCLVLAEELAKLGAYVRFICRHLSESQKRLITTKGCDVIVLRADDCVSQDKYKLAHSDWLGVSQSCDALGTKNVSSDRIWNWIIVDHYGIDICWENAVRTCNTRMLVIDDLYDRAHHCEIFLNQNIVEKPYQIYENKLPESASILIGPRYSLLRPEFEFFRRTVKIRQGSIKRILVLFGGADLGNMTGLTLEALTDFRQEEFQITVVIGELHTCRNEIENICFKRGYEFICQASNMAELMVHADLAIGAAGTTSWERCCVGLPSIIVSIAENQVPIAITLQKENATFYLGTEKSLKREKLIGALQSLIHNPSEVKEMSNRCFDLVDGRGVKRVIEAMENRV